MKRKSYNPIKYKLPNLNISITERPEFENSVGVDSTRVLAVAREENFSTKKREADDLDVFQKLLNENEELLNHIEKLQV